MVLEALKTPDFVLDGCSFHRAASDAAELLLNVNLVLQGQELFLIVSIWLHKTRLPLLLDLVGLGHVCELLGHRLACQLGLVSIIEFHGLVRGQAVISKTLPH